jgi:hypothetical protein
MARAPVVVLVTLTQARCQSLALPAPSCRTCRRGQGEQFRGGGTEPICPRQRCASAAPQGCAHLDLSQLPAVGRPFHFKHVQLAPLEVLRLRVGQLVGACGKHRREWEHSRSTAGRHPCTACQPAPSPRTAQLECMLPATPRPLIPPPPSTRVVSPSAAASPTRVTYTLAAVPERRTSDVCTSSRYLHRTDSSCSGTDGPHGRREGP